MCAMFVMMGGEGEERRSCGGFVCVCVCVSRDGKRSEELRFCEHHNEEAVNNVVSYRRRRG